MVWVSLSASETGNERPVTFLCVLLALVREAGHQGATATLWCNYDCLSKSDHW